MPVAIPAGHGTNSKKVKSNSSYSPAGWGHFSLESQIDDTDKGFIGLTSLCHAHTDAAGTDTKHSERLYYLAAEGKDPKKLYDRILYFALKLDLVTEEQIDSGESIEIDFADAIGRQYILHIKEEKYTDKVSGEEKKTTRMDYKGIYKIGDEGTDHVPLDHEALALAGIKLPAREPKTNGKTNGAAGSKTTKATTTTAPADDLGDL